MPRIVRHMHDLIAVGDDNYHGNNHGHNHHGGHHDNLYKSNHDHMQRKG